MWLASAGRFSRAAIVCGVGVLAAAANAQDPPKPAAAEKPRVVTVSRPVTAMVDDYVDLPGQVAAAVSVPIVSRVSGVVERVMARPGELVVKGQVLFVLDSRMLALEVEKAQAVATRATIHRDQAAAEIERMQKLLERQAVSQDEVTRVRNGLREVETEIVSAQASLSQARLMLEATNLVAPIDGRLSDYSTTVGSPVAANTTVLATVTDPRRRVVQFGIPEATMLTILKRRREGLDRASTPPRIFVWIGAGDASFACKAWVAFLGESLDPGTRMCTARAEIESDDATILPGFSATVRLYPGTKRQGFLVASSLIHRKQQWNSVFVTNVDRQSFHDRPVDLGDSYGPLTEVDLNPDIFWVLIDAEPPPRDGKPFVVREVPMPGSEVKP